jgi:hypothetical protein
MPEGIPYASTNVTAGTGPDLNYIGKHCFALSGMYESNTSAQIVLGFSTGNKYIRGTFQWNGFVQSGTPGSGNVSLIQIRFNDIKVSFMKVDTESEDNFSSGNAETFVIPPYTNVTVRLDGSTTSADLIGAVNFQGEVYD